MDIFMSGSQLKLLVVIFWEDCQIDFLKEKLSYIHKYVALFLILLPFPRHKEHRREKIETNKERLWKSKENMIASLN